MIYNFLKNVETLRVRCMLWQKSEVSKNHRMSTEIYLHFDLPWWEDLLPTLCVLFKLCWQQDWNSASDNQRTEERLGTQKEWVCERRTRGWRRRMGQKMKLCGRKTERERKREDDNEWGKGSPVRPTRSLQAGRMKPCNRVAVIFFVSPGNRRCSSAQLLSDINRLGRRNTHMHTRKHKLPGTLKHTTLKRHTQLQIYIYLRTSTTTHHFRTHTRAHTHTQTTLKGLND